MHALLRDFCKSLAASSVSQAIQAAHWIIPTIQTIHILAVAVIFTSAIMIDLRLWRVIERDVSVTAMARRFFPPVWVFLLVALASGVLMIIGEPRRALENSTFYLKMALLVSVVVLTCGLQRSIALDPRFWEATLGRRIGGRIVAGISILLWCGIVFAGRWIAYTQVG
ncbi:MAG TPA: DUF6644 family protein [Magnetospirillaceae bacterium]|nr:DUF6644 family protein [Magnetospirillaceae bacterium]